MFPCCAAPKMFYCCFPRLSRTEANSDCLITHTPSLFCNSVVRVFYLWQFFCLFHFSWCLCWVSFRNKSLLLISILKNKFFLEVTQGMVSLASLAPWDKLSAAVKHKDLLALLQSSRHVDNACFACCKQPSRPSTRKGSCVEWAVPFWVWASCKCFNNIYPFIWKKVKTILFTCFLWISWMLFLLPIHMGTASLWFFSIRFCEVRQGMLQVKCYLNEYALQTRKMTYFTLLNSLKQKHFLSKRRVYPLYLSRHKFISASFFSSFWFTLLVAEPSNIVIRIRKGLSCCTCKSVKLEILIWLFFQLVRVHLIATLKSCFSTAYWVKNNSVLPFLARKHPAGFSHHRLADRLFALIYFFPLPLILWGRL